MSPPPFDRILPAAASAGGSVLHGVFAAAARMRPSDKPLHPRGQVVSGTLTRTGVRTAAALGTPWLDEPGDDEVLVRLSRSVGLPPPLPDVLGIALRIPFGPGRVGDLLFSTTGRSRLGRFLLVPRRQAAASYSTVLPYRTGSGALVVLSLAATGDDRTYALGVASLQGPWRTFATLAMAPASDRSPEADLPVSFDPVLNTVPGLDVPDWVSRLREGAYSGARRVRTHGRPDPSLARPTP